jgi:hypothetical protein
MGGVMGKRSMKALGGALVMPIFGADGKAYLSLCEAHHEGRVFDERESAWAFAQQHNDVRHGGRVPRVRTLTELPELSGLRS